MYSEGRCDPVVVLALPGLFVVFPKGHSGWMKTMDPNWSLGVPFHLGCSLLSIPCSYLM